MDGYIRPQGLDGYQNPSYTDDTFDLFTNVNVQNDNLNWGLSINSEPITQSNTSHLNWQQPSATNPSLDTYGRQFSKSPSAIQAPTNFNYGDPRQFTQSPYDPSLVPASSIGDPASAYAGVGHSPYSQQPLQHGTIAPQALQHGQLQFSRPIANLDNQAYSRGHTTFSTDYARPIPSAPMAEQFALSVAVPKGDVIGMFSIIDPEKLTSATNSCKVNAFVNVGQQEYEYPVNKAIVPAPPRRRSRNELRELAKNDPKMLTKLGKKHHKKSHNAAVVSKSQQPAYPKKQWQPTPGIKYEGDSSSEYSSSEESDSDYSEDELAEPSPLPPKRPDTPLEAVTYDAIKATWRSKRFEVDSAEIRSGLGNFWDVVRTIRDRWKTDTLAVTEAEEKKKYGELPLLKSRVKDQRNMFEAALVAANKHGHKSILELFGENTSFLYLLYQFLVDRFKEEDYDGLLTRAILEILANCTTLSEENLEKTRLGKVYTRFARKGSAETQALVKRIDLNVQEYKKKKTDASTELPSTGDVKVEAQVEAAKIAPNTRPAPEPVAGVKRAAPTVLTSGQPSKRVASGPASPASATSSTTNKAVPAMKRTISNSSAGKLPVMSAGKLKPTTTKPSGGIIAGAGVKKPVSSKSGTPSIVANALKSIEKKAAPLAPPAKKPAFSFAETMANLTKPKEKEPSPKEEDKRPPETAEQKAKRLRKEQRRKMRVTFKPDNQLVQIRLFHHDAEEELGHEESMIRDVSDVGGEGRMFKQHKDMIEADDDEEPGEEDLRPYTDLVMTDFSSIDDEERKRSYAPYGGGELQPQSPERITREQYEANTLMAYDSPPCPREPADPYNGESLVTKEFGAPGPQSIAVVRAAQYSTLPTNYQQQTQANSTPDISAILAMIKPQQQQQQPSVTQAASPMPTQAPGQMSEIQRILANLPQVLPQQQQQSISAHQPQASVTPDISSILANLQPQVNGPSVAPPVQQQQQQQQQPPHPIPVAGVVPDPTNLAAILSQLGHGQANGSSAPPVGNFPPYAFPAPLQNYGQAQQQVLTLENEERRRWRESEEETGNQRGKWGKKGRKDNKYTLPCKYFQMGKCQKGSNCTYLHEM